MGVTDGTLPGTQLLTPPSLAVEMFLGTVADNLVVVSGTDEERGHVLWVTDGTPSGTRFLVDPLRESLFGRSRPGGAAGDQLVFFTVANGEGVEPWVTDGTPAGTHLLRDINPGGASSFVFAPSFEHARLVFFLADDGGQGPRLWRTDGTLDGTQAVSDKTLRDLRPVGELPGFALFLGQRDGGALELWRTNGQAAGTSAVAPFGMGSIAPGPPGVALAGELYFPDPRNRELWHTNGISVEPIVSLEPSIRALGRLGPGLVISADRLYRLIPPGRTLIELDDDAAGSGFYAHDDRLFFNGTTGLGWTDGTPAGTQQLDAVAHGSSVNPLHPAGHLGKVFFQAFGPTIRGVWRSDGTEEGTQPLDVPWRLYSTRSTLFCPHSCGSSLAASHDEGNTWEPVWLTSLEALDGYRTDGDRLEFVTMAEPSDGSYVAALWETDGTPSGTTRLSGDIVATFSGSNCLGEPRCWPWGSVAPIAGARIFAAGTMVYAVSASGESLLLRASPTVNEDGFELLVADDLVTWVEEVGDDRETEIWVTDGTVDGTRLVEHLPFSKRLHTPPAATDRHLLFSGFDEGGWELWSADLRNGGASRILDAYPGRISGSPLEIRSLGTRVVFTVEDPEHGRELWVSDGTAAGTRLLADIWPGPLGSYPEGLVVVDGLVLFAAGEPDHGNELWATDGDDVWLVADVAPGPASSSPLGFAAAGDLLYFAATSADGRELWAMPRPALLFADSFESGDLSKWTTAVP